jgi:hypothetical protein
LPAAHEKLKAAQAQLAAAQQQVAAAQQVVSDLGNAAATSDGTALSAAESFISPGAADAKLLRHGTKWAMFEPNEEPLWAQLRLNIGTFMQDLFQRGVFQGVTPRDAYFVKCGGETTTATDISRGVVNIVVGFAPLRPAEFVLLRIQRTAGQIVG